LGREKRRPSFSRFLPPSFILGSAVAVHLAGVRPGDVLYNPLPLYHSSAGMLAVGPAALYGVTVALRKKFSATHFWSDCVRYRATVRPLFAGGQC
jgi:solute carrier family 27 fatty acid transporter 1/4